jgi:hypothetical protein
MGQRPPGIGVALAAVGTVAEETEPVEETSRFCGCLLDELLAQLLEIFHLALADFEIRYDGAAFVFSSHGILLSFLVC